MASKALEVFYFNFCRILYPTKYALEVFQQNDFTGFFILKDCIPLYKLK